MKKLQLLSALCAIVLLGVAACDAGGGTPTTSDDVVTNPDTSTEPDVTMAPDTSTEPDATPDTSPPLDGPCDKLNGKVCKTWSIYMINGKLADGELLVICEVIETEDRTCGVTPMLSDGWGIQVTFKGTELPTKDGPFELRNDEYGHLYLMWLDAGDEGVEELHIYAKCPDLGENIGIFR